MTRYIAFGAIACVAIWAAHYNHGGKAVGFWVLALLAILAGGAA